MSDVDDDWDDDEDDYLEDNESSVELGWLDRFKVWFSLKIYPRPNYGASAWVEFNEESNMFSVLPKYSFGYDDKK